MFGIGAEKSTASPAIVMNDRPASASAPVAVDALPPANALLNSILRRADAHFAREDWVAARDALGLAVSIAPDNPQLLGALGSLHFRLKDYPEASAALGVAVRQNPDNPDLRTQLAMVHIELKRMSEAEAELRQVLVLRPDDPTALKLLADCYRDQRLYQDAAAIYEKLVDRHSDQVGVLLSLAKCFYGLGDMNRSLAALDRVLMLDPTNATARENWELLKRPSVQTRHSIRIRVVDTIEEFKRHFVLQQDGVLLETDLDIVETDCDLNSRRRRDAEVLTTLAANTCGDCLDLGTSHGHSAFKLATNLDGRGIVHTVNILPEQYQSSSGQLITHLLTKEQIGAFYRGRDTTGINQIYADTCNWEMPAALNDLAIVFVDAAHDTEAVFKDSLLIFDRVRSGGYIIWHDFHPQLRDKFGWIDAVMRGVERFFQAKRLDPEIVHLKDSWMGVWQVPQRTIRPPVGCGGTAGALHPTTALGSLRRERWGDGDRPLVTPILAPASPPSDALRNLRYAFVYPSYSVARDSEEANLADRLSGLGYCVQAHGIPCFGGWWPFPKLDQKWRTQSADLMSRYGELAEKLRDVDVLIAAGGSMLHPEFLRQLSTFNVFLCADDPESSAVLSQPVAAAFDFCCVANIACVNDYVRWGVRHAAWLPHPVFAHVIDRTITEERLLTGTREVDLVMCCERIYGVSDRAQRLERLYREFPQAILRGKGWAGGFISEGELLGLYRRARIGWNLHNSIGPANTRMMMLPALGVMQICDCSENLGKVFKLGEEVIGFDTMDECVDATRYYLAHEDERCRVALAGWKRVLADYTEEKWWHRLLNYIAPHLPATGSVSPPSGARGPRERRQCPPTAPWHAARYASN